MTRIRSAAHQLIYWVKSLKNTGRQIKRYLLICLGLKKDKRLKSHPLSRLVRLQIKKSHFTSVVSIGLILGVLFLNLITSPVSANFSTEATTVIPEPEVKPVTETFFKWPLRGLIYQGYRQWHRAIDIASPIGTPVKAMLEGEVVEKRYLRYGYGHTVVVKHIINNQAYFSRYAHLNQIWVDVGDQVNTDTKLGNIGMTGWTTGPHLHLEIKDANDQLLNPLRLLPKQK